MMGVSSKLHVLKEASPIKKKKKKLVMQVRKKGWR